MKKRPFVLYIRLRSRLGVMLKCSALLSFIVSHYLSRSFFALFSSFPFANSLFMSYYFPFISLLLVLFGFFSLFSFIHFFSLFYSVFYLPVCVSLITWPRRRFPNDAIVIFSYYILTKWDLGKLEKKWRYKENETEKGKHFMRTRNTQEMAIHFEGKGSAFFFFCFIFEPWIYNSNHIFFKKFCLSKKKILSFFLWLFVMTSEIKSIFLKLKFNFSVLISLTFFMKYLSDLYWMYNWFTN